MDENEARTKVRDLAQQAAEDEGLELVSADLLGRGKRTLLRVVVDKEAGVTIADCERMSRCLEALLDVEDPIKSSYVLEVSSPGLDRPLTSRRDFERNVGKLARVVTSREVDGATFFVGRIVDVGDDWIRLTLEAKGGSRDIFIPLSAVSKARLEIEMRG